MPNFTAPQQRAIDRLAADLDGIFGPRLESLVVYHGHQGDGSVHSCALVEALSFRDLSACLPFVEAWHHRGAAAPLLLTRHELERTIDVFPVEYATIAADHAVIRGEDPFAGISIAPEEIRRACEAQAKSLLIHLREAFLESHGETTRVARLVSASAAPLRALLSNIARLPESGQGALAEGHLSDDSLVSLSERRMGVSPGVIRDVLNTSRGHATIADPSALLARYIPAAQRIWEFADAWQS